MIRHSMLSLAASTVMAGALLVSTPLAAAPDGNVNYKMARGDTLIELADDYFINREAVDRVVRLNRIKDPRRIPIGANIKIPRRYLRFKPVDLRVSAVSGPVFVTSRGKEAKPKKRDMIREGDVIRTGRNGFIAISGYGNSRLSLPSNSRARLIDARRYLINDLVDIQVKVLEGRGNVVAPKLREQERYRVGSPLAVTAVRGTQFRVGYSSGSDLGVTEVVEGDVVVANDARAVAAPAGFGVAASSEGVRDVEELLPPPVLIEPSKIQTEADLSFTLNPLPGAIGYRTQIAKDITFLEVVAEVVTQDAEVVFGSLDDGRYHVRSRAIAQSGVEGLSVNETFRRKQLGVSASAEKSDLDDAFKFAWQSVGSGPSYTAFQLWQAGKRSELLVDETGMVEDNIFVSSLENGTYRWRVAAFQMVDGEAVKVWSPVQEFRVNE